MRCDRIGCTSEATHEVVFELRATPGKKPSETATSTPIVRLCNAHKDVQWADVYTKQGWDQICAAFQQAGKMKPEIRYSNIVVRPIDLTIPERFPDRASVLKFLDSRKRKGLS